MKHKKETYPYIEATLLLNPSFPAHMVVREKKVTSMQYNKIKPYTMTPSSDGKRKLGKTSSNGFALIGFCESSNSGLLNNLYKVMMYQAVALIEDGLGDDYGILLGNPHPELSWSLKELNVYWSKKIPKVSELSFIDQNAVHVLEDCLSSKIIQSILKTNDDNQYSD